MNREHLRQKALLAARTVVLAATLTGCPLPEGEGDSAGDTSHAAPTDTASPADCIGTDEHDGSNRECCRALLAWCQAEHPGDEEAVNDCTYGPGFDGSTGCIPWGPPVPPRFRGAA